MLQTLLHSFIDIRLDFTEIWLFNWYYLQIVSFRSAQLTVKMFKSDVRSVRFSRVHIYAVDHATDSLLCQ